MAVPPCPLEFITFAERLADRARLSVLEHFRAELAVDEKSDLTPVTVADQRAETLIVNAIRKEVTDLYPMVAEEAVSGGHVPDVGNEPFWLIDPLDGTKQFVTRKGEFTVNIALIENRRPIFGVVHAPALGSTYWGSQHGAFAITDETGTQRIHCREFPQTGIVAVASRSHRNPETDAFLEGANPKAHAAMQARFAELLEAGLWRTRRNSIRASLEAAQ